jgi:heptosyltransferase III
MPEKRGKILVIRGGAIGDFVLTLPAIAALRATFPNTHLELLGYPKVAKLARAAAMIDGFRSIEAGPLARFFARHADLDDDWSAYFESFNLIFSFLYDPDDIFKTNVGRASQAQFIQGSHRPSESDETHATAVFLQPLERLAIYDADPVPKLSLPGTEKSDRRWVAAHPGSGSEKKNWPKGKWRNLLARLISETDLNLLLVAGEAEGDWVLQMGAELPSNRVRVAQDLPLCDLASLLSTVGAFVGHDSGITHIAAALALPTLVLWGPSNEKIWRPIHQNAHILKDAGGLENLAVDLVFRELLCLVR